MKKKSDLRGVLITAEGFEDEEVLYPVMRLHEEGIIVDVATKGAKLVEGRLKFPLELIVRYYSKIVDALTLKEEDYDFVLLPGGFEAPDRVRQMTQVLGFVKDMDKAGKLIGAFCHGPWIVISAKIIENRYATGYIGIKDDLENAGAIFLDEATVWDGNLLTSRHPRDVGAFMQEVLSYLKDRYDFTAT